MEEKAFQLSLNDDEWNFHTSLVLLSMDSGIMLGNPRVLVI